MERLLGTTSEEKRLRIIIDHLEDILPTVKHTELKRLF